MTIPGHDRKVIIFNHTRSEQDPRHTHNLYVLPLTRLFGREDGEFGAHLYNMPTITVISTVMGDPIEIAFPSKFKEGYDHKAVLTQMLAVFIGEDNAQAVLSDKQITEMQFTDVMREKWREIDSVKAAWSTADLFFD